MKKAVGFDQKILLHHLDYTALETKRTERKEMYEKLNTYLLADIRGDKSRKNAITMLMKIWYLVEEEHRSIQQKALELFSTLSPKERLVLHYGMTVLAYPFFKDVVTEIGVLSQIQFEVPSTQVHKRVKALYGERRRVEVAISAVLTTLRNWGLIDSQKNIIVPVSPRIEIQSTELKNWLVQVILKSAGQKYMPLESIREQPMLFPFEFWVETAELEKEQFDVSRQGIDMIFVGVR